ncbi:Phenazine biosynthesis PhzC PhzF protein domain containing protein [Aphelenchoides fujianensis]|nr:Phenazine biosynthesis PhzC PhzF protein domain containing protein [Aphelenchoides fujianensis]
MSAISFSVVNAFTSRPFGGNPAVVCVLNVSPLGIRPRNFHFLHSSALIPTARPLTRPLQTPADEPSDESKQKLAAEFNLSETAFPIPLAAGESPRTAKRWNLRWFTPANEVPLCGHATLATAHAIFSEGEREACRSKETSRSFTHYYGCFLRPFQSEDVGGMSKQITSVMIPEGTKVNAFAYSPESKKLLVVLDPTTTWYSFFLLIKGLILLVSAQLMQLEARSADLLRVNPTAEIVRGLAVGFAPHDAKAQGFANDFDYVLRYFSPWNGIPEDPATGSAQCLAAPVFGRLLGKKKLKAFQSFPGRGAEFFVDLECDEKRLKISGQAVTMFHGQIDSKIL